MVLSYKGSTNTADWKANFKTFSIEMFPDLPGKEDVKVHKGFLEHKERLDKRMSKAEMLPIANILSTWGVTPSKNFRDFLLSGQWKWCICVGHSLGGAMSAISALELSVRTGKPVCQVLHLPRKVEIDVAKRHACYAKSRSDNSVNREPSAVPEPV